MKILDLGCGSRKYEGEKEDKIIGVDIDKNSHADVIHDLEVFPYPFDDDVFDIVHTSHVIEHINNPIKFLEEITRILKHQGKLNIRTPHFSSSWAYGFEHIRFFSASGFKIAENLNFKINYIKLNWLMKAKSYTRNYNIFLKLLDKIINFLANKNIHFCERFWCYYVGGFSEIEVEMVKK